MSRTSFLDATWNEAVVAGESQGLSGARLRLFAWAYVQERCEEMQDIIIEEFQYDDDVPMANEV